ncbi:MAG: hypothetical protein WC184_12635 [Acidimicrobiia bacterium]
MTDPTQPVVKQSEITTTKPRVWRGFTIVDVILTVALIAVISVVAIVSYREVMERSKDRIAEQTVRTVLREAQTLAAFKHETLAFHHFEEAFEDLVTSQAATSVLGVQASTSSGWGVVDASPPVLENVFAQVVEGRSYGVVSIEGETAQVALEMLGRCALAQGTSMNLEGSWVYRNPGQECGSVAFAVGIPEDGGSGGLGNPSQWLPVLNGTASPSAAELNWSASSAPNITQYQILRDNNVVATVSANVTSWVDNSVVGAETYLYQVVGVTGTSGQLGSNSLELSIPVPPVLTGSAGATVALDWSAAVMFPGPVTQYQILRDNSVVATVPANTLSWVDNTISGGVTYTYQIQVVSNNSPTLASNQISLTDPAPSVPVLSVTNQTSPLGAALSWTASVDAGGNLSGYRIYRDNVAIATVSSSTVSWFDSNVTPNVTYQYHVDAYDSHNQTGQSQTRSVTVTPPPVGSFSASATIISSSYPRVTWTAAPNATSYTVTRSTGHVIASGTTALQINDTSASAGTNVYYLVTAYGPYGTSYGPVMTNTVYVPVPLPPAPSIPGSANISIFIAAPTDGVSNNVRANLSWGYSPSATSYTYYLFRNGSLYTYGSTVGTSATVTGLTHGASYSMQVYASNSGGSSGVRSSGTVYSRYISWPVRYSGTAPLRWIDTGSGNAAYYGPSSQPGINDYAPPSPPPSCPRIGTLQFWNQSGTEGRQHVWYGPSNWRFGFCSGTESRFQADVGSQPAFNSSTNRVNTYNYSG